MRSSSDTGPLGPVTSHLRIVLAPSASGSPHSLAMSATVSSWPMASPRSSRSFFSSGPVTCSPFQIHICGVRHTPGAGVQVIRGMFVPLEENPPCRLIESLIPDNHPFYWRWIAGVFGLYDMQLLGTTYP